MSATTRNYAYIVEIEPGKEKPVPTLSLETLRQYQADIQKYISKEPENPE